MRIRVDAAVYFITILAAFYHYEECGEQAYTKSKGEPKYLLLARVKYIFSRAEMLKFGKLLIS